MDTEKNEKGSGEQKKKSVITKEMEEKFIWEATNTLIKMQGPPNFGTALLPDDDF